ncbi:unnamed protein product [Onchocerca ochengi]|uniref:Uncharacterized protein n=1 Tax=Onchocerca ochengi TaxID=42157 RepID=A0A182DWJ2_ONCOC|nr:unnamed protein product [Onchocerca ochengi]
MILHHRYTSIDPSPESVFLSTRDDSSEISRKTSIDSRVPNGSLLSLRTFYAFGARSGRTPSLQRIAEGLSCNSIQKWERKQNQQMKTEKIVLPKLLRNTVVQNPISTRSLYHTENDTGLQRCEQSVNVAAIPEMKNEMLKPQEDSAEMIALTEKNKSLEEEVKRLTSRLREKEQSEKEFRRKLLEYAAEIKVWKKKYETQKQTATIEIRESKGNGEEISDIIEQLNNAAEKLTRLDAVKDLKLLQNEMETALKEISK